VNWYPEVNELSTQADGEVAALVQVPGYKLLATIGTGPIRGMWFTTSGRLAVVSGNEVYRVAPVNGVWTAELAGIIGTNSGPVSMADNGTQLIIVDGAAGYIISLVNGVMTQITSEFFVPSATVVFQDGYFIAGSTGMNQFAISGLYDGFSWDGLDFGVVEGSPDNVVAVVSNMRQIWLLGQETIEVWWNTGNADFPFQRIDGAFIEYGCAAAATAHKFNNAVAWLGGGPKANGIVWLSQGFAPKRISNHAVEFAIQQAADLSTSTAWTYQENGHAFYCLNLPGAKTTWVYDSATEQWSERVFLNQGNEERHRGEVYALAYNAHTIGDYQNGKIYQMDADYATFDGSPILRLRRAPHISADMNRVFYKHFQLAGSMGQGLDGSPVVGQDPVAELRYSDDFGFTWSPYLQRSLGPIGAFRTRALWHKLGQSRNRVYEIRITDPIKFTATGAELDHQPGNS
jgi:hypothetical protein